MKKLKVYRLNREIIVRKLGSICRILIYKKINKFENKRLKALIQFCLTTKSTIENHFATISILN